MTPIDIYIHSPTDRHYVPATTFLIPHRSLIPPPNSAQHEVHRGKYSVPSSMSWPVSSHIFLRKSISQVARWEWEDGDNTTLWYVPPWEPSIFSLSFSRSTAVLSGPPLSPLGAVTSWETVLQNLLKMHVKWKNQKPRYKKSLQMV